MKFACSNIAWKKDEELEIYPILRSYGIKGIEIAPSILWPNLDLATKSTVTDYLHSIADEGFEVPAIQAILYGTDFQTIFQKNIWPDIKKHLIRISEIAELLNAKTVVFGAPKLRNSPFNSFNESVDYVLPFFRDLANIFGDHGACLCIEPSTNHFGSNFVTNSIEAEIFVDIVNHNSFGIHLDSSALYFAAEEIKVVAKKLSKKIKHFHMSEPYLNDFTDPIILHRSNIETLIEYGYEGWFSIEMLNTKLKFAQRGAWKLIPKLCADR